LANISTIIGSQIDPNVTMDIHRIFRLPGSLNSKSGLSKVLCKDLQKFDPYSESSFLNEETIEINSDCPIEFKLKSKKFGPYYNEKITVPTYAAVYMICKNLATIA
jgi:DNA primase small subunit